MSLFRYSEMSLDDIYRLLSLSQRRILEIIKEFIDAKLIQKIGQTKGSYYILNPEYDTEETK